MYELIILSILMKSNAHGYRIAKIINDIIGPFAKISNGRLYPLLAHLAEAGLIEAKSSKQDEQCPGKGHRPYHTYQITTRGRQRFHHLMMDTSSNPGEYQRIFLHKIPSLHLLTLEEQLYLIDHYINYCQSHILHLKSRLEDMTRMLHTGIPPLKRQATLNVMQHMLNQWQREIEWIQQLREQATVNAAQSSPSKTEGTEPTANISFSDKACH